MEFLADMVDRLTIFQATTFSALVMTAAHLHDTRPGSILQHIP